MVASFPFPFREMIYSQSIDRFLVYEEGLKRASKKRFIILSEALWSNFLQNPSHAAPQGV